MGAPVRRAGAAQRGCALGATMAMAAPLRWVLGERKPQRVPMVEALSMRGCSAIAAGTQEPFLRSLEKFTRRWQRGNCGNCGNPGPVAALRCGKNHLSPGLARSPSRAAPGQALIRS